MNSMEIKMAKLEEGVKNIGEKLDTHICDQKIDLSRIEKKLDDFICGCDNKFADKEQFVFWRNLLILGIIVTIFLSIVAK